MLCSPIVSCQSPRSIRRSFALSALLCLFSSFLFVSAFCPVVAFAQPTNLQAVSGHQHLNISWNVVNGATYNLYRATTPGSETLYQSGLGSASYPDDGLNNGQTYYYQVSAVINGSESNRSPEVAGTPSVHINCGETASPYTDANGVYYAADTGFMGGSAISTATTITGTNDQAIFQKQRASNSSFSYSIPTLNGVYGVTFLFAEIQNGNVGANKFKLVVNGRTLAEALDINALAGGKNAALSLTFRVNITANLLSIQLIPVTGSAAVAGIVLGPPPAPAFSDIPAPGYAVDAVPADSATDADGAGPGSSMLVNLASLTAENAPGADIASYNPVGPSVSYARYYRSAQVADPTHNASAGLSAGWTDNYDIQMTTASPTAWSPITLRYPNNATQTITPTVTGGTATFTHPAGAPYVVSGVPSGMTGQWTSLTLTFKDRSKSVFGPAVASSANQLYLFRQSVNVVGRYVDIVRDAANGYRLQAVSNDIGRTLLSFAYSGANLSAIQDLSSTNSAENRQVNYTFAGGFLSAVSQIGATGSTPNPLWQYGYALVGTASYLNSVRTPDPSRPGSGNTSQATYSYTDAATIYQTQDATNRLRTFDPTTGGTKVAAYSANGNLAKTWQQKIGPLNLNVGGVDAAGNATTAVFADPNNPYGLTSATNRNSQTSTLTYDDYGNVLTATSPRGVKVTNTYDITTFAPGLLLTSQTTNPALSKQRIGTSVAYYTSGAWVGMVYRVTSPKPGTTYYSSPATVDTTYTYTNLGNVATITGPNANGTQTVTFGYGANEKLGQPLTVTVSGPDYGGGITSQTTTYAYDGRSNVTSVTDASGYTTNLVYNLADQVTQTLQPATGETGTGRVAQFHSYQYPGGPLASTTLYDESNADNGPNIPRGTSVRQILYTYTAEGEVASVLGSTQPVYYAYDGAGRVSSLTDGNSSTTYYLYDSVGNLALIQYPRVNAATGYDTISFTKYDKNQNLLQKVDGRGVTTDYTRADPESQVTQVAYSNVPSSVQSTPNLLFRYDTWGRRSQMFDYVSSGSVPKTYTYDDLDNPLRIETPFSSGDTNMLPQSVTYAYNPDGSRASMFVPFLGTYSYQYDGLGRLTALLPPWLSAKISHTYYPNGWLNLTVSSAGATNIFQTVYAYNPRGLVSAMGNASLVVSPSQVVSNYNGIRYDAAGNRKGMTTFVPAQSSAKEASRIVTFGYDTGYSNTRPDLFRDVLLSEISVGNTYDGNNAYGQVYNRGYGYDNAFNANTVRNAAVAHNADNQRTTAGSGGSFSYDGNGNPTTYNGANFTFDCEDRLSRIVSPSFQAYYDGDGRRAKVTTGAGTVYYVYDEASASQLPLFEVTYKPTLPPAPASSDDPGSASGPPIGGGTTTIVAANAIAADGWRARYYPTRNSLAASFYTFDPQGNLSQRTTADTYSSFGTLCYATSVFDAYGVGKEIESVTGQSPPVSVDPIGFGGQWGYYTDNATGLLCLSARYYDPATGRFVTRDPIGYEGGVNLYTFAGGNPVNDIDPLGFGPPKGFDNIPGSRLPSPKDGFLTPPRNVTPSPSSLVWIRVAGQILGRTLGVVGILLDAKPAGDPQYDYMPFADGAVADKPNYPYHRPVRRPKGFRDKVWEENKSRDGNVYDPVTDEKIEKDSDWDLGHKPGYEYRKHVESARRRNLTRAQFLKEYNNSNIYRPEKVGPNRGHRGEAPDSLNNWP